MNLSRDPHDIHGAIHRLAARHGNCIVIQNLVSDIDLSSHTGPDGKQSRMKIGPIPNVLENMAGRAERGFSDPTRSFPAHLSKGVSFTIHPLGHIVAADSGKCPGPLRHLRRSVVRTARTEVRRPAHCGILER